MAAEAGKKVILVGVDNKESFYSLEWTLNHILDPYNANHPFKLVLIHVKVPAVSVLRLPGPGAAEILPIIENDLNYIATAVIEQAKELCEERSIPNLDIQVVKGDARSALCEAVEKHNADMLVVGSHGYEAFRRTILGSVRDYCAHHAHCSVLIVKKPKDKAKH